MRTTPRNRLRRVCTFALSAAVLVSAGPAAAAEAKPSLTALLDAPLLFIKRHPYMAGHIYDDYYTWRPGGGIYVIENPGDPPGKRRVRTVIDPTTRPTLGEGVYRDANLSWDARRIVFAFKGQAGGNTSIYEIGIDGRGLRRLTDPGADCKRPLPPRALGRGRHDITPCYLPDGRIVFTSTRPAGRVPCFNSEVDILHVMNADGSDVHPISVNNVNEFDPSVLPDGRIVFGRWEYVNKTALYMQSLWTIWPDGSNETALFANNLAKPTAVLDVRPVPGSHKVVASLTPHNGQAVGAIAVIDPRLGKNSLAAITNFTPKYPTKMDQGLRRGPSDPWPLSENVIMFADNAKGTGGIFLAHRDGRRELVYSDPKITCYSPMLVKPRPRPPVLRGHVEAEGTNGRFFVQDIYHGLAGVTRGEVTRIRVVEETARISGLPGGGRWWNQAFLTSWQGSYVTKNVIGVVDVREDGSAFFEVPPGRALYLQALDAEGRALRSMRTFIQATPGRTRSCVGCHENKMIAPPLGARRPQARLHRPARIRDESWGSGFVDYPTMVQPILDRHCVTCHGGAKGIAGGLDLSGGWTWAFNISYETLIKNTLVGFLNCHNGAVNTARILPARAHGSGPAPLANVLVSGHKKRIANLTRAERDLIMAWMDLNCSYFGTYNYTEHATCTAVLQAGTELGGVMRRAGCTKCHAPTVGNDWINLRTPRRSRILRAPLARTKGGPGLAWCRDRKARAPLRLVTQRVQPPDVFRPRRTPAPDPGGREVVSFASTDDTTHQAMLGIIERARGAALARARVDMPGADIIPGQCRLLAPLDVPETAPQPEAVAERGEVTLTWPRRSMQIGLTFEVHRGADEHFPPTGKTRLGTTTMFGFVDRDAPGGRQHYAVIAMYEAAHSLPARVSVHVEPPPPPEAPTRLTASGQPGRVILSWRSAGPRSRYVVYRKAAGAAKAVKVTPEPTSSTTYFDHPPEPGQYVYQVRTVGRGGVESPPAGVTAKALPQRKTATFVALAGDGRATRADGSKVAIRPHGRARISGGQLDLTAGGHATVGHIPEFDLDRSFSVECWIRFDRLSRMPVVLACGSYGANGWFVQAYQNRWRWHVGGTSCDGGKVVTGTWVHVAATFDGARAAFYQDGKKVASVPCRPDLTPWTGPLVIGQYSKQADTFQVFGRLADLKLYRRSLRPDEVSASAKTPRR